MKQFIKSLRGISIPLLIVHFFVINTCTHGGIRDNSVKFVAEQKGPLTLDPHTVLQETNVNFYDNIYEGMTKLDVEGNVTPSLAVSWKYIGERVIEFKLRKNVRFHNGELFDAHSVKYSYERFFDPKLKSQAAGLFMYYNYCEVVDDYTVRIYFKKPNGTFIAASSYIKIIPKKYHQKVGEKYFEDYPVGTGPFKVIKRNYSFEGVTNEIKMVKFKNYWQPDLVKIDSLSYLYMCKDKAKKLFYKGEIDLIKDFDPRLFQEVLEHGHKYFRFDSGDILSGSFNTLYEDGLYNSKRPFLNKKVREAINLAINRSKIREDIFHDLAKGAGGPTYESQNGYYPLRPYPYDPERAKELLAEAGYPNGFKDFFWVEDIVPNLGEVLKEDLSKIGVDIELKVASENLGMQTIVMPRYDNSLPNPSMGCFVFTCPDFGFGHSFFLSFIAYHSNGPWSIMSDQKADELFDQAIKTIDEKKALNAWGDYHTYMRKQHYYVPILQRVVAYAAAKKLNFHPGSTLDFTMTSWEN